MGNLVEILVVAEDHRFFYHHGVDPVGICRAVIQTTAGNIQGASTIEQQLIRTITGRYEISLRRKFKEICLALSISHSFEKRDIAVAYLNTAYFGNGFNGIEEALSIRGTDRLGMGQPLSPSLLVSYLKYPNPKRLPDKSVNRRLGRAIYRGP